MMIPKNAKICPYCRKKLGWTLPAKIFLIILGLIAVSAAINSGNNLFKPVISPIRVDYPDAMNLRNAKEALSTGRFDDAEKYLNMINIGSWEWKNEGLALMDQVWEMRKNSPDTIKKEKEAANYVNKLMALQQDKLKASQQVVRFNWEKSGFGTVAILTSITIENTSSETCKDISGIMSFSAASGTVLGLSPFTIYDTISPHSKRTFRNINVGLLPPPVDQVKSATVEVLNCK